MNSQNPNPLDLGKDDPYLWLEDISGDRALAWVKERNAEAESFLAQGAGFMELETDILRILDSKDKIPYIRKNGDFFYNLWQDEEHPRGLWRRTTLEEYRKPRPQWETVLDIDDLGKRENESWVFHGAEYLRPNCRRCLVSLSRGGSDACVIREFDMTVKDFMPDGFQLPEAKSFLNWIDKNNVFVGTDFGPGSLAASGYPRIVKRWRRGTPLSEAETVFAAKVSDMMAYAYHDHTEGFERDILVCMHSAYKSEKFLLNGDGTFSKIEAPEDSDAYPHREWLLVRLRTPWGVGGQTFPAGALLAARFEDFLAGKRALTMLFEPSDAKALDYYCWTRHHLFFHALEDVKTRVYALTPDREEWKREQVPGVPAMGTASVNPIDPDESDEYFLHTTDFLTPTTFSLGRLGQPPEKLKEMPAFFNAKGLEINQYFTTSDDGTRVPYFQVSPVGMALDGSHFVLLTGYGGFEIPLVPNYGSISGRAWLEKGGVLAVANIRGGGEYGPRWHQAALRENRLRAYEDFAAVARDLVSRGVTSAGRLGISGGSNGGLLVGNMLTRYPSLFGAVVCQMPLLDMKRYSHMLAGASWIEEYGDPDKPEDWAFMRAFSPYHNVKAGVAYPPVFFMTTSKDDRVHPGHARKMAAVMQDLGCDSMFWENVEGGHGAGADNRQTARFFALMYAFLWKKFGGGSRFYLRIVEDTGVSQIPLRISTRDIFYTEESQFCTWQLFRLTL